jgi:hypothetical protein
LNRRKQLVLAAAGEVGFGQEERPLRVEHLEVTGNAADIAQVTQAQRLARGGDLHLALRDAFPYRAASPASSRKAMKIAVRDATAACSGAAKGKALPMATAMRLVAAMRSRSA